MHGPEESDSVVVAMKPTNKAEQSVAEPVEPRACPRESGGRKPRETPTSKARAGRRTGQACHRRWNAYGKQQGKEKGAVHVALAPCRSRHVENSVLRDEAGRCTRRGRHDMGDLRAGPRS